MHIRASFSLLEGTSCSSLALKVVVNQVQIFLLFQTTEVTGWSRALVDSRSAYTSLKDHLLRFIDNPNEIGSALDPLDDDQHVSGG